ncbi:SufS family cysteine desulfurase [Neiella marina]|uniref:cysteine desulfurase n=1 Tax=Neiella holothuriorum TaxID=2870530 RepID=A0ABS7EKF7_9GAMM|nr:SufS family cysteine desulfurase [Neiella holothuriorum]MBW8192834.1 SufS family cysteine desulfurase [Neiella holothuriorum]
MNRRIRQLFPALQQRINGQPLSYLDSAATSQKPAPVIAAVQQFYRRDNANVHRAGYTLAARATAQFEQARATVAGHFGMPATNLVWTKGCTEAINLVAFSWALEQLSENDVVLVSGLEHHANLLPWQQVCRAKGARLVIVPVLATGELDLDAYRTLLAQQPKLVAVAHVSNVLGTVNPVAEMIDQAHQVGAKVLVDGAQAAAHLSVDVGQLNADFYTFSGHKMYGPTGIGGVLMSTEAMDACVPWQTGGEMVEQVSYQDASWASAPHCFEAGTPNIAGAIGLASAVQFLQQLPSNWQQQEAELLDYAKAKLNAIEGIELVGETPQQVAVQSFISRQIHPHDLAHYLDQAGVSVRLGKHCAHPLLAALGHESTLRLSLACYSNQQDIDQLVAAIELAVEAQHEGHAVGMLDEHSATQEWTQASAQAALAQAKGWQQSLSLLIELGRRLPSRLQANRQHASLIAGCESQTWLQLDQQGQQVVCRVDSEANVVRGILHLLALEFNQLTAAQQLAFDGHQWLAQGPFSQQLSTTRQAGIGAVVASLHQQIKALREVS